MIPRIRNARFKLIGILNAVLGTVGLVLIVFTILTVRGNPSFFPISIHFRSAFYFMVAVNIVFLSTLILTSRYVWHGHPRAIRACRIVFLAQALYWPALALVERVFSRFDSLRPLADGISEAAGIGNVGIAPQLFIIYPIVGFFVVRSAKGEPLETTVRMEVP